MIRKRPDWRWAIVKKAAEDGIPPEDAFLRDVYSVMLGELKHEVYVYALELYTVHQFRDTMMAWFLSGATTEQILQGSGVDIDALAAFEKLFIDATTFRNKMEWRAYAEYYVANCCYNEIGEKQVKMGTLEGPIPLLSYWRIGNELIKITDEEIMSQQVMVAHIKALAARNASVTDPVAKEAFKWGQFAVAAAGRRNVLHDVTDSEVDAIVAIQKRKATLEAHEIGLDLADIKH